MFKGQRLDFLISCPAINDISRIKEGLERVGESQDNYIPDIEFDTFVHNTRQNTAVSISLDKKNVGPF